MCESKLMNILKRKVEKHNSINEKCDLNKIYGLNSRQFDIKKK